MIRRNSPNFIITASVTVLVGACGSEAPIDPGSVGRTRSAVTTAGNSILLAINRAMSKQVTIGVQSSGSASASGAGSAGFAWTSSSSFAGVGGVSGSSSSSSASAFGSGAFATSSSSSLIKINGDGVGVEGRIENPSGGSASVRGYGEIEPSGLRYGLEVTLAGWTDPQTGLALDGHFLMEGHWEYYVSSGLLFEGSVATSGPYVVHAGFSYEVGWKAQRGFFICGELGGHQVQIGVCND